MKQTENTVDNIITAGSNDTSHIKIITNHNPALISVLLLYDEIANQHSDTSSILVRHQI